MFIARSLPYTFLRAFGSGTKAFFQISAQEFELLERSLRAELLGMLPASKYCPPPV